MIRLFEPMHAFGCRLNDLRCVEDRDLVVSMATHTFVLVAVARVLYGDVSPSYRHWANEPSVKPLCAVSSGSACS